MTTKLVFDYQVIDIFTTTRFRGGQVAIVHLPEGAADIDHETKRLIAREFNVVETVIMHDNPPPASPSTPWEVTTDIFTPQFPDATELRWTGNPTVAASWHLLTRTAVARDTVTLKTKAGDAHATINRQTGLVHLQAPLDEVQQPNPTKLPRQFLEAQTSLKPDDYFDGPDADRPIVTIVQGVNFIFLGVTSEDALNNLKPVPVGVASTLAGLKGLYSFWDKGDGTVRARLFFEAAEDPAAGSAVAALGWYLGEQKGPGEHIFTITQGLGHWRSAEIQVRVEVGSNGKVNKVILVGKGLHVMEGKITVRADD